MPQYRSVLKLCFLILVISTNSCSKAIQDNYITIGALLPLTGKSSDEGLRALNGLKLAKSEINKNGSILGKNLDIVVLNDRGNEKHIVQQYHALKGKGVSASIGAIEISEKAAKLETAGNASDLEFIQNNLSDFVERLSELLKNINYALAPSKDGTNSEADISAYIPIFQDLITALESKNMLEIDRIIEELEQKPLDSKSKDIIEKISDNILMTEFNNAIKTINEVIH